ncbi:hypothetical protein EXE30_04030 [Acinetobacter halotolerans]|uniref:Uncharacterized protein n=1 Tax=Acinetobacter halotolerans TaxID=1752076 RepID=A0A4Q6XLI7_9GAMM|nr:hypothetical protein EXE30_04030 [Acinetobacter halotolerans]
MGGSATSYAATNSGQTTIGVIERIYITGYSYNVRFVGEDNCAKKTGGSNEYYTFPITHPTAKSWYALLLVAAQTKKPVVIRAETDCATDGNKVVSYMYQDFK